MSTWNFNDNSFVGILEAHTASGLVEAHNKHVYLACSANQYPQGEQDGCGVVSLVSIVGRPNLEVGIDFRATRLEDTDFQIILKDSASFSQIGGFGILFDNASQTLLVKDGHGQPYVGSTTIRPNRWYKLRIRLRPDAKLECHLNGDLLGVSASYYPYFDVALTLQAMAARVGGTTEGLAWPFPNSLQLDNLFRSNP